jgi:hypothetical protein
MDKVSVRVRARLRWMKSVSESESGCDGLSQCRGQSRGQMDEVSVGVRAGLGVR